MNAPGIHEGRKNRKTRHAEHLMDAKRDYAFNNARRTNGCVGVALQHPRRPWQKYAHSSRNCQSVRLRSWCVLVVGGVHGVERQMHHQLWEPWARMAQHDAPGAALQHPRRPWLEKTPEHAGDENENLGNHPIRNARDLTC
ncbi:unnamed protein product [Polarella glacialis]|uniref:Uncharacterized protein n=1 Tax=Polarella glacialis TaxID=89957 RepID=A0A813K1H1_POLGL|nr:unnamed protein product [Polarella glacialis]CAE8691715.1 unnamed protein product [Polarella glacialis]